MNVQSLFRSLESDLAQLDEERIKTKNQLLKVALIYVPVALVGVFVWGWGIANDRPVVYYSGVGIGLIALVAWGIQSSKIRREFVKSFKERVILKIIKKMDPSFAYTPDSRTYGNGDSFPAYLRDSNLFETFARCFSEDSISGTITDRKFEFREVKLERRGKTNQVVFQGIVITVTLKNAVPSPVYVLPDSANQFRDSLWKMLSLKTGQGEVVLLDHEPFEKLYKVYADDAGLPGRLLKRNALDGMVKIHEMVGAINPVRDAIRLAFANNTLTIAISLKEDLFEPRLGKPINDQAFFEKNVQYLTLFLGLIEELKLD